MLGGSLSMNFGATKIKNNVVNVCGEIPLFYLRTSSSLSPLPSSTRKRKTGRSDSIRPKGLARDHEFNLRWLRAARRILKPDGTIWVTGTHHIIFSLGFALQSLGFRIINSLVWHKPDPPPNALHTAFTHLKAEEATLPVPPRASRLGRSLPHSAAHLF
jgi:DNA methylase